MSTPFSRLNPFSAVIKDRYPLTKPGSTKEVYHISLDVENLKLPFKVGDSLGVYGDNDPMLVERLCRALGQHPATLVVHPRSQETMTLQTFLTKKAHISRLTTSFLKLFSTHPEIQFLLNHKPSMDHYLKTHEVLDFFTQFAAKDLPLPDIVAAFSPLLPRFYSVASSPLTHPKEVHLTVAVSSYMHKDELRYGVASHFLSHLAEVTTTPIPCYVQPTPHFTLPEDDNTPIIMVGPGTGVAPFRGFLQERISRGAKGENWLFFGERHQAYDFFYDEFWHALVAQEKLRLDLAFSRDQHEKVYVQHKLHTHGAKIWAWLEQGAYFYVCGEADPMAKDVEATLLHICQRFGNLNEDAARLYIKNLRHHKRYLTDVY